MYPQHELSFVTACDTRFLNPLLIAHLFSLASHGDVIVPPWQTRLQPLRAVYHRRILLVLRKQLDPGELQLLSLYQKVCIREVGEEELLYFTDVGLSFNNLNHPEGYGAALALWHNLGKGQIDQRIKGKGITSRVTLRSAG